MTKAIPPKHIVLYADDDEDDLLLVQEAFTSYASNIEVITTYDGMEAIAYLSALPPLNPTPCLIILDINMPRLNGKEALKRIRTMDRFAEIPVVLFTTSSLHVDRGFAEKYNAGFITKPLDTRQMAIIADSFIEHCAEDVRNNIRKKL